MSANQTAVANQVAVEKDPVLRASPGFQSWLLENECSLAITSHQSGRLIFAGLTETGGLWAQQRLMSECHGLWADADQIWVSTSLQLWNFRNVLPKGRSYKEHNSDRLYCPRVSYITGALNIHDIALMSDGQPIFVNTQYSCLATPSVAGNFAPVWQPDFITALTPDERCHLNGLAMENGKPRFVTARGRTNDIKAWRANQLTGGILVSVPDNEIVTDTLPMPHSPRLHNGKLWVLASATAEFGTLDLASGKFEPVCFCPGYLRGLALIGNYAVVGLSKLRKDRNFIDLPFVDRLARAGKQPSCGLVIVDLVSGKIVHALQFGKNIEEVSDIAVIKGVRQPAAIGFGDAGKLAGFISMAECA